MGRPRASFILASRLCSDAQVLINHLLTNAQFASHVRLAFPRRTLALQVGDFRDGQGIRGSRSRIMWVLDDIVGLFSVYAGSFSRNLGRSDRIFSTNMGPKRYCYRILRFVFVGRNK
jgi:hypothetical protein